MRQVHLLDYGAGNVRSLVNAVESLGWSVVPIASAADFDAAERIIFPGVGAFGQSMQKLADLGLAGPLREYLKSGRPYLGICIGLQALFEASDESPGVEGLGVIPTRIRRFEVDRVSDGANPSDGGNQQRLSVPSMGWNGVNVRKPSAVLTDDNPSERFYFVHSYMAPVLGDDGRPNEALSDWILSTSTYGIEFVSAVQRGNIIATQFHPEKSGASGLALIRAFLESDDLQAHPTSPNWAPPATPRPTLMTPRIIACLDVRANDAGDLVVTKGDQYDVREKAEGGDVRNLGKPVELAQQYYRDGADEISFLNITSFRQSPLEDQPMLEVLRQASRNIFVPLTVGGGIRDTVDPDGTPHSALEVAALYFRSGADKVSIGSDAVEAAMTYLASGVKTGRSSIETISKQFGAQAVVISVDPKRVFVKDPADCEHHTFKTSTPGPNGEEYCWFQCTVKGGRETRNLGAYELVKACQELGAGEILLNCIDKDGTNSGYDLEFIRDIKSVARIPVIASSGAGKEEHLYEAFALANADAALAAGMFHRGESTPDAVKKLLASKGLPMRMPHA